MTTKTGANHIQIEAGDEGAEDEGAEDVGAEDEGAVDEGAGGAKQLTPELSRIYCHSRQMA